MSENFGQGPRGSHSFDELARGLASGSVSRRRALKLFVGAAIASLIPSRALAQTCPPNQVLICHRPPGNPSNEQERCVGQNAVQGHLTNHCDCLGPCSECNRECSPPPPPPPPDSPPPPPPPDSPPPPPPPDSPPPPPPPDSPPPPSPPPPCKRRGERCGGDRPDCCGNLVCKGEPGHKHCRRRRRDDD
jgi:outer membrane biosynthesis protein TonB